MVPETGTMDCTKTDQSVEKRRNMKNTQCAYRQTTILGFQDPNENKTNKKYRAQNLNKIVKIFYTHNAF